MIRAATLAGGASNQDRYVIGEGFAAVLDGATSVAGDRSHDPGWYAEQLARAIGETVPRGGQLSVAVAEAIRMVRDAHDLEPLTTPTSTVALARWSDGVVETYTLGDSYVVVLRSDGTEEVHTDDRLDSVGVEERNAYQQRLAEGRGYDTAHRALLLELQAKQAKRRNRPDGYWIAGSDPDAARHGLAAVADRTGVIALLLASDGVAIERQPDGTTWTDLYLASERHGLDSVLQSIHAREADDLTGQHWPRSKVHDDKTLVTVTFPASDPGEARPA